MEDRKGRKMGGGKEWREERGREEEGEEKEEEGEYNI